MNINDSNIAERITKMLKDCQCCKNDIEELGKFF